MVLKMFHHDTVNKSVDQAVFIILLDRLINQGAIAFNKRVRTKDR